MGSLLGTAFSDAVVSYTALRTAKKWYDRDDVSVIPAFAFMLMSLVSGVASIYHARDYMHRKGKLGIIYRHSIWLTWTVIIPMFSIFFCHTYGSVILSILLFLYSIFILGASMGMSNRQKELAGTASASLAFLLIFIVSIANEVWSGVFASGLYLLAGWVVGMEGELREVGVYNDVAALANVLFASSL